MLNFCATCTQKQALLYIDHENFAITFYTESSLITYCIFLLIYIIMKLILHIAVLTSRNLRSHCIEELGEKNFDAAV